MLNKNNNDIEVEEKESLGRWILNIARAIGSTFEGFIVACTICLTIFSFVTAPVLFVNNYIYVPFFLVLYIFANVQLSLLSKYQTLPTSMYCSLFIFSILKLMSLIVFVFYTV